MKSYIPTINISSFNHRVVWNKTKRMSIPFFFEPSYDFKMNYLFLNNTSKTKGIVFEKFLNKSLKKFVEYQR
jgi:isopenicillin N synthase-like dioxygenase